MNGLRSGRLAAIVLTVLGAAGCAHPVPGQGWALWQLRGSVVSVDDRVLRVRHKSGDVVELVIDDRTTLVRGAQPETAAALARGARVMIDVESLPGGLRRAERIHLLSAPKR
jgi:hypothetical protein